MAGDVIRSRCWTRCTIRKTSTLTATNTEQMETATKLQPATSQQRLHCMINIIIMYTQCSAWSVY